ncbi:hypothetical protein VKT23_011869 [Stygiomarasmius scandens]|uniref:Uncharacterized protein n=1 Tax=Marasmiellus scandens TaxID=2682957 RepID=A0ABR1J9R4_9AGAR
MNPILTTGSLPAALLSAAVFVPFSGVLVRYRANYIHLDGETGMTTPEVKSYFAMLRRVYRLEGWAGLYKGFMPVISSTVLVTLLFRFFVRPTLWFPDQPPFMIIPQSLFVFLLDAVVGIPISVITNRAICTPYVLPFFSPKLALGVLLSPTERRRPWKIYYTPGLFSTKLMNSFSDHIILGACLRLVAWAAISMDDAVLTGVLLTLDAVPFIMGSLLITALQVVVIRLTLQRIHDDDVEGETEAQQATKLGLRQYSPDTEVMGQVL